MISCVYFSQRVQCAVFTGAVFTGAVFTGAVFTGAV
ncbi:pentapeptide repeat-containing protein [Negativicoccus succinicivorans]